MAKVPLEESGSPATNGPMIKADKEAMQNRRQEPRRERHPLLARTHPPWRSAWGARWQSHHSRGRSGHRHPCQIAGPHFRAILLVDLARSRRPAVWDSAWLSSPALRAGERRSDFGLVA